MLYSIKKENIFNVLNTKTNVTTLAELFSSRPDERATPAGSYVYMNIVSDNVRMNSNKGNLLKTARVSFYIICKKVLGVNDTEERVLHSIMSEITNTIVSEGSSKISNRDGIIVNSISEDSISPIFTDEENRAYLIKDYLFNYISHS